MHGEVAVVFIPGQQTPPFQKAGYTLADGMQDTIELFHVKGFVAKKSEIPRFILFIYTVQKQLSLINFFLASPKNIHNVDRQWEDDGRTAFPRNFRQGLQISQLQCFWLFCEGDCSLQQFF